MEEGRGGDQRGAEEEAHRAPAAPLIVRYIYRDTGEREGEGESWLVMYCTLTSVTQHQHSSVYSSLQANRLVVYEPTAYQSSA